MIRFNQLIVEESHHCGSIVLGQDLEMGALVRFPVERVSQTAALRVNDNASDTSAKILFFSGVRYSLMTDNPSVEKVRRTSKSMNETLR